MAKDKDAGNGKDSAEDTHKIFSQADGMAKIFDLQKLLDKAASDQGIQFAGMNAEVFRRGAMSTGSLALDLLMGGGHGPGRFTYFYGPTGACKSTILFQSMREAIASSTKSTFFDTESSLDPSYLDKIGIDLDAAQGYRNKQGTWDIHPSVLYSTPNTVEQMFGMMHTVLKSMPDKIVMDDNGEPRFFLIHPDFDYKPTWLYINKGLKEKKIVEIDAPNPQMVFFVDSLKMATMARDEDNSKETIAMLARSLSNGFSLVKGYLGKKMCNLVATNHLTINPMARFQNPETEPGGQAVQFYPDIKIKLNVNRANKRVIVEPHVSGHGSDRYLEGTANIIKNKLGPSFRKMQYRVWIDERGEPGRGLCPVFDMYQFLWHTGQLEVVDEKKGTFAVHMDGVELTDLLTFADFKKVLLTDKKIADKMKKTAREQLHKGVAQERYYENLKEESATEGKGKKKLALNTTTEDENGESSSGGSEPKIMDMEV